MERSCWFDLRFEISVVWELDFRYTYLVVVHSSIIIDVPILINHDWLDSLQLGHLSPADLSQILPVSTSVVVIVSVRKFMIRQLDLVDAYEAHLVIRNDSWFALFGILYVRVNQS